MDCYIVQELCESRGGRPGLSVLTSLLVSVDVKLYIEPCFGIGHSLSLICQLTSEDIEHHFIIMWTVSEDAACIVGRSATKVISEDLGSCGRGGPPQDLSCCRCCCCRRCWCRCCRVSKNVVRSSRNWRSCCCYRASSRKKCSEDLDSCWRGGRHRACVVVVVAESLRT